MTAVEDARGITHAVVMPPNAALPGATACNARFSTGEAGAMLASWRFPGPAERMAASEAEVTCMACVAGLSNYDEA